MVSVCFFRCILTTRLTLCFGLSRFLFGAPMGATRHEHQSFHSRMHGKDGATGQFTSFAQKNFSTPTATSSNVVGELSWSYRKGMLGSTYPVLSTIYPHAFLRCTGQPCVHMGTPTMALESNTDIYKAADSTNRPLYVLKRANSWTRFSITL